MRIYIDQKAKDYNPAQEQLLKQAGYEVCWYLEVNKAAPAADPNAWKGITTMEAVYKYHGLENGFVPDMSQYPPFMRAYKVVEFKAQLMAAAINGTWVADWTDIKQRKYYPYWDNVAKSTGVSGRGLSLYDVGCGVTYALVGPRLCFESDDKVRHAVKYFTPVFEDHYFTV